MTIEQFGFIQYWLLLSHVYHLMLIELVYYQCGLNRKRTDNLFENYWGREDHTELFHFERNCRPPHPFFFYLRPTTIYPPHSPHTFFYLHRIFCLTGKYLFFVYWQNMSSDRMPNWCREVLRFMLVWLKYNTVNWVGIGTVSIKEPTILSS